MWPRRPRLIPTIAKKGFALQSSPDRQRQSPVRAQDAARLGEGGGGIGHQHVAEPAKHAVDGVGAELDSLGVDHAILGVGDAAFGPAATRGLEHRRREVARDQVATLADDRRGVEAGITDPGGELEHGVALAGPQLVQHPFPDRRRGLLDLGPAALPGRAQSPPPSRRWSPRTASIVSLVIACLLRLLAVGPGMPVWEDARSESAAAQSGVLPMRPVRAPSRTASLRHASRHPSCGTRSGCGDRRS